MLILGAGLAGCIAGVLNQEATIYEASDGATQHQAVLRFRTPDVGVAVGIPFKKVKVYKGIYYDGRFIAPDIRLMNMYSEKVTHGGYFDRSIADTKTDYRWVAPEGFHSMLKRICSDRIYFNHKVDNLHAVRDEFKTIISTVPINILANLINEEIHLDHQKAGIYVTKFKILEADLQQTIYFPSPDIDIYRATMTGDILRIESMEPISLADEDYVAEAFGIKLDDTTYRVLESHKQPLGKLIPMDDQLRRDFIRRMSRDFNVYSLGRFATWRNILLDDVLKDIHQIRKFMLHDEYDFFKGIL